MKNILLVGSNGYIASKLYQNLNNKYNIFCIDNGLRSYDFKANNFELLDYRNLTDDFLSSFTDCVWLAGHSNVPQSLADPTGCFENNLAGLIRFLNRFSGRLIYASSGSVYNNTSGKFCSENDILGLPVNMYDFTKMSFDRCLDMYRSSGERKKFIGLRFGTVVGSSLRIRSELLLNKMVLDGMVHGKVNLANPNAIRPVLFINDLINAIDLILQEDEVGEIYNLSSINASMKDYATAVSAYLNISVNLLPDSNTYSFGMCSEKFTRNYSYEFEHDISVILDDIKNGYLLENSNVMVKG